MGKLLNKVIQFSIYSLVFLLPVFFLPFSVEPFDFNKQYVLFFLVSLAFLAWMSRMIICDKEIKFRRTPLDIPVLVFMFFSVLSTVFSVDKTSSFLGFYGRFNDSLISILSLGALYFLITNNIFIKTSAAEKSGGEGTSVASVGSLLKTFLWSAFFVLLFSYFSVFGGWQLLNQYLAKLISGFQLPQIMLTGVFNPIGGSLEALAIFLAITAVLLVGLLLREGKRIGKIISGLLLFLAVVLLIIIDFTAAWLVLGLVLLLFLAFAFWSRIFRERVNVLLIPIFLVIISIVFTFIGLSNFQLQVSGYNVLDPPREILLDQKTTWQTTWETIKSSPILGSGLGTFSQDFSEFKPKEFNQTDFWQIRFDRGANQVAEMISTMGVLGTLSWLTIIGFFLIFSWFYLRAQSLRFKVKEKGKQLTSGNYQFPLVFAFLAVLIAQFFYYQNITLAFAFWLMLGLSVVSWQKPNWGKAISFKEFPEMNLVFNIVLIVILLIILGVWFFGARAYLADVNFKEGVALDKIEKLEKAVDLNQFRANYRIILSRGYFSGALNESQKDITQQNAQKIQNYFAKSIDEAKKAVASSPNWAVTYENLGMIYRDIQGFVQGVTSWSVDSFRKASKLEPTNPVFPTEIGKLLLQEEKIEEAKKEIEKALGLKPDYSDAEIQMALISEHEGDLQGAINALEGIIAENPQSVEAHFQLGRVYYNNERIDEAISQFKLAIQLFPNHSNSLYSLGLAYQKKGQDGEALKMFERVLKLNPGNQDIMTRIEELKGK